MRYPTALLTVLILSALAIAAGCQPPLSPPAAAGAPVCDESALEARDRAESGTAQVLASACRLPPELLPLLRLVTPPASQSRELSFPDPQQVREAWNSAWPFVSATCPDLEAIASRHCLLGRPAPPAHCPTRTDPRARMEALRQDCGWRDLGLLDDLEARAARIGREAAATAVHHWLTHTAELAPSVARQVARDLAGATGPSSVSYSRQLPGARHTFSDDAEVVIQLTAEHLSVDGVDRQPVLCATPDGAPCTSATLPRSRRLYVMSTEPVRRAVRRAFDRLTDSRPTAPALRARLDAHGDLPYTLAARVMQAIYAGGARHLSAGVHDRDRPELGTRVVPLSRRRLPTDDPNHAPLNLGVQLDPAETTLSAHPAHTDRLGPLLRPIPHIDGEPDHRTLYARMQAIGSLNIGRPQVDLTPGPDTLWGTWLGVADAIRTRLAEPEYATDAAFRRAAAHEGFGGSWYVVPTLRVAD